MVYYLLILGLWIKRYEFCKIGLNSDLKTYLNRVYIVSRHVAASDCTVPFRLDLEYRP
jgi:hypothetical protein